MSNSPLSVEFDAADGGRAFAVMVLPSPNDSSDDHFQIVVGGRDGVIRSVQPTEFAEILAAPENRLLISDSVPTDYWRIRERVDATESASGIQQSLDHAIDKSRWIDLRSLRRLVNFGNLDLCRDEASARAGAGASPRDEITRTLDEYADLSERFDAMRQQAERPSSTEFHYPPPAPDEESALQHNREKAARVFAAAVRRRAASIATVESVPPPPPALGTPTEPRAVSTGPRTEVRAGVLSYQLQHPQYGVGLRLDESRTPELLQRCLQRYREASDVLRSQSNAGPFRWNAREGVVGLNGRGYPDWDPERLQKWLRVMQTRLVDLHFQPIPIPRSKRGLSTNPAHWSPWLGCVRELVAWRDLVRMAGLVRTLVQGGPIRPRYQSLPAFTTDDPNLEAIRSFGLELFRPAEGCRFHRIQFPDLRLVCFLEFCSRNRILQTAGKQIWSMVRESGLCEYLAKHLRGSQVESGRPAHPSAGENALDSQGAEAQLRTTQHLFSCSLLGFADSLLVPYLKHQYDLSLTEPTIRRAKNVFREQLPGYEDFLHDAYLETLAAGVGISTQSFVQRENRNPHPMTAGIRARKQSQSGHAPFGSPRIPTEGTGSQDAWTDGSSPVGSPPSGDIRRQSVCGRLTPSGSSAFVQAQALLLSEGDFVFEMAVALTRSGVRVVAVVPGEIVCEVSEDAQVSSNDSIRACCGRVGRLLLGEFPLEVNFSDLHRY